MTSRCDTPAQRLSDESVRMLRDLFAKHAENGATIFHQAHAEELLALAEEVIAMRSETALTDEKGGPMTYWGGAASPDKKDDAWRSAALRLGEQLAPTGPNWYYAMTPTQWLEWCQSALPSAVERRLPYEAEALLSDYRRELRSQKPTLQSADRIRKIDTLLEDAGPALTGTSESAALTDSGNGQPASSIPSASAALSVLERDAHLRRKGWNAAIKRTSELAEHYAGLMKSEAAQRIADEIRAMRSDETHSADSRRPTE